MLVTLSVVAVMSLTLTRSANPILTGLVAAAAAMPEQTFLPGCPVVTRSLRSIKYDKVNYVVGKTDASHQLTIYVPNRRSAAPLPVAVWIHGGAWMSGRGSGPGALLDLLKDGIAVVVVNYRLIQEAPHPAQIDDLMDALRFIKKSAREYNLDANRVVLWGSSAGGHLAALLGTVTANHASSGEFPTVKAVCDWCGPTDLVRLGSQRYPQVKFDWMSPTAALTGFLRGSVTQKHNEAIDASPVTHVNSSCPPFLIMHGTADSIVPIEQSEELYQALKQANVDVTFIPLKNAEHDFDSKENFRTVEKFFRSKL